MAYTNTIGWETLRSVDSANLNGTYQAIGTPLTHQAYIVKMVNNSPSVVTVSINGTSDVDVCPGFSFWLYDDGKTGMSSTSPATPAGTQFYVKGSASGTTVGANLIYLVVRYVIVI